ncbi:uncharacterized protein LOC142177231 [Nicotiana tabacum]|uniref:Uncharacterized protein LOC142177231 n=1 Tax=Nicotiana tabacum TaxID=4097 RepID=A0AC58TX51_TOBAC
MTDTGNRMVTPESGVPQTLEPPQLVHWMQDDEDKLKALKYGPYTFNNRPMMLKQWEPDFDISKETNRIVPIWVLLPGLPIQYWATENLGRIASYLGKLVCTNKLTTQGDRISYAKILVDIDISQPLPEYVLIEDEKSGYKEQRLEYEWKPSYYMGLGKLNRKGWKWSWCNKREATKRIYSNIDWVFGNPQWFILYIGIEAFYDCPGVSDHSPIIISTDRVKQILPKPFRLLNAVMQHREFKEVVQQIWGQTIEGYAMYSVRRKLKLLEQSTNTNREFSSLERKINPIRDELKGVQEQLSTDLFNNQLSTKEKELLHQIEKWEGIHEQIIKELPNDKSPGIDGYLAEFFKQYWDTIGSEITEAVLEFFANGKMLKSVNCTTVTLVSKVASPTYVKGYRHIACCTTLYKVIAKILTGKLKIVVDYIVGPAQSVFIEGRNILDNVILAHELVKGYTQKCVSPRCLIKVDIRKAYDSMEWPFLKMVLLEYGIPAKFVDMIMECVTTVSYSLLLNGGLTPKFQAKKGLRQGDPMSLYLFVLVMEYLNRSLKTLEQIPDFNYHPRADRISIQLILQAFHHFYVVTGLKENMEKSSFYVAGVNEEFKASIL